MTAPQPPAGSVGPTTGPWSIGSVANKRGYRDEVMVYGPNGALIANCEAPKVDARRFVRSFNEDRANACLIAAAPLMFEALEAALEQTEDGLHSGNCDVPECWVEQARAAKAAARPLPASQTDATEVG